MKDESQPGAGILIADGEPAAREALRLFLEREGYAAQTAASPEFALDAVGRNRFDLLILDIEFARENPGGSGLLDEVRKLDSCLPVVVATPHGSNQLAAEAISRGARDFFTKPWEPARLSSIVRNQIELGRALRNIRRLETDIRELRKGRSPEAAGERE